MRDDESQILSDGDTITRLLEIGIEPEASETAIGAEHWPTIPGYETVARIGQGGSGTVFRATQHSLNRTVAIKVLASHLASNRHLVLRFQREAKLVASLSHPNLVTAFDAGEPNGNHYLVMEYVEGKSVEEQLQMLGRMKEADAIAIVIAVAEALQYAHEQGMVHRDVKPGNILVDTSGRVRLADLGLARALTGDGVKLTQKGTVMGTPAFLAPEQALGDADVDGRADIYSLGATLYCMLTGYAPIPCHTIQEAIRWHASAQHVGIHVVNPELSPELAHVVERAMARDLDARYPTAQAFGEDLRRFQQGEPATGSDATETRLPAASATQRKKGFAWAAVLLGVLCLAGAGLWLSSMPPDAPIAAASRECVLNGDFEDGFNGWDVSAAPTASVVQGKGVSSSAAASLDPANNERKQVRQRIATEKGTFYHLTYSFRPLKPVKDDALVSLVIPDADVCAQVAGNEQVLFRYEPETKAHPTSAQPAVWVEQRIIFYAPSSSSVLAFEPRLLRRDLVKTLPRHGLLRDRLKQHVAPDLFLDAVSVKQVDPQELPVERQIVNEGRSYRLLKAFGTWDTARQLMSSTQGQLPTVNDEKTFRMLTAYLLGPDDTCWVSPTGTVEASNGMLLHPNAPSFNEALKPAATSGACARIVWFASER